MRHHKYSMILICFCLSFPTNTIFSFRVFKRVGKCNDVIVVRISLGLVCPLLLTRDPFYFGELPCPSHIPMLTLTLMLAANHSPARMDWLPAHWPNHGPRQPLDTVRCSNGLTILSTGTLSGVKQKVFKTRFP